MCQRVSPPLEGAQVDLSQRPLVDLRTHRRALDLTLVANEVLRGGGDPRGLQPLNIGNREFGCQDRVLGEAFEVAIPDR